MPKRTETRAVGEFAASRHGTFTLSQAAEHDISRRDVARMERNGVIVCVRRSVWRFASQPVTWRQELYAATLEVRAAASHFSAAALHGIDGLTEAPSRPEVICHHSAPVRVEGALVRRTRFLPRNDIMMIDAIPCTTLARTACDLAPLVDCDQLLRMIDHIQRAGASMAWLMQRATKLKRAGRRGPPEVLDIVRRRLNGYRVPDSWFERLLEACLDSPLLGDIERQHALRDVNGLFVARFDLAVPRARLGIEGHSRSYHVGELAERYDEDRDLRSAQQGWEIAYLGFAATRSPVAVRRDIELIVERRVSDLGLDRPAVRQLRLRLT